MSLAITFVSPHLGHVRGGGEINDIRLGDSLSGLGHDVSYVTLDAPGKEFLSLDHAYRTVDCPYWYDRSYDLPEPLGKALRHLNEELFVHRVKKQHGAFLRDRDLVLATGRPILSRLRSTTDGRLLYAVRGRVNPLYDRYLAAADGLVFWGGCEREYESQRVLSRPHISLDPAVDSDLFRPLPPSQRARLGSEERITIGFVGRLEPVKRIDRIIDAVAALEDTHPLYLVVVGDGSRRAELETQAARRLPAETFDFVGRVEQAAVPQYLNSIDVFVMASRLENHPIALKEAIACGTYCVAPDIGRIGEILDDGHGRTYSPADTPTLVDTLAEVLDTAPFRAGTRQARAHEFNTWDDNARSVVEFYHSLEM